jgi:cobalt-precorrin-5B (C1)-methyltransferase
MSASAGAPGRKGGEGKDGEGKGSEGKVKTGKKEGDYRNVLGSVEGLRRGFTSGTSAQAASLAAAQMLLSGELITGVEITLRDGRNLLIPVVNARLGKDSVSCGVIKDAGDDDDVTHGAEFRSEVSFRDEPGVVIQAGDGVGRVTRKGLPISPGDPAVNPNPRRRITEDLLSLAPEGKGFNVVLSIPEGAELAKKTWNPRLGIEGGLSIIGTTGVVEPRSSTAYKASIALAVKVLKAGGADTAALAFGYVGENYYRKNRGWEEDRVVKFGDYFGFSLDLAAGKGFEKIVIAGHVGKMSKVAAGLFNTHWSYGDARLETVAAWAGAAGGDRETLNKLLELKTAEEAVAVIRDRGLEETWSLMNRRVLERCRLRLEKDRRVVPLESVLLDLQGEELARDSL